MMGKEAGGTVKKPTTVTSIVVPCWIEKVWSWARQRVMIMVQQEMGTIPSMILAFSTCVTLQSFHGLIGPRLCDLIPFCFRGTSRIAALSRNLEMVTSHDQNLLPNLT